MTTVPVRMWLNGKLVLPSEGRVEFLTPALHYGVGAFEGIRCYRTPRGPAIFRLQDHLERLVHSARVLGWRELPFGIEELTEGCRDVVRASGFEECYIRPLIWQAEGGWNLTVDGGKAYTGIAVWEWKAYLGPAALEQGVRANVSTFTRHHPNVMMTKAKISGNYPNSVLAKTESLRLGFDEAILLDAQGMVAECTGENIFAVRNNVIITPPMSAGALEGITQNSVMRIAEDLGFEFHVDNLARSDLYIADEVFVCGTAAEISSVKSIDDRNIPCPGPMTKAIAEVYARAVRGEEDQYKDWCELAS